MNSKPSHSTCLAVLARRRTRMILVAASALTLTGVAAAGPASAAQAAAGRAAFTATAVASPGISAPPDVVVGEADGFVNVPVKLSAPGTSTVSVAYATANSSASSGTVCNFNYVGVSGTLTFSPGVTTKVVRVNLLDCGLAGFRSFTFNLSSPVNATIIRAGTRVGIVGDANVTATPGLYVRDAVVDNTAGTVSVPVLLGGPSGTRSNSTVTVSYATHDGSAVAGTDYSGKSGTLTFSPGQTVKNISVPILDRSGSAPTRSFTVKLGSPVNAAIVDSTGVVTIGASGAPAVASPGISAPPDVLVGEAGGYVDVPVTLSAPGTSTVSVTYATANSSASGGTVCNFHYIGVSGTLTFSPGVTTKVVRVDLLDCGLAGFRSFTFNLSSPVNATIIRACTRLGIVSDGNATATPGLYVRDAVVDNTAGTVSVPVLLGGPSGTASNSTVTVAYATHNASATAGTDYSATSGTLTFGPGQTVKNISVPVLDRSGSAPSRSFTVTLRSPVNAAIVDSTGVVTIGASGAPAVASPGISAPPDVVVGEAGGFVDVPVTLSAPGKSPVSVAYATANSSASSGTVCNFHYVGPNGTLTFSPGVTTKVVRVDLLDCGLAGFRSFTFNLTSPTNATITRPTTRVGIVGDGNLTATPGLYVRDAVVDNTAGTVNVPVLLGGPAGAASNSTVTVAYATHDASAVAGTDYAATSGTLTFGPGQTIKNISVPILDRSGKAPSRGFSVALRSPVNAAIVDSTGVITIGASGAPAVSSPGISAPPDVVVGEASGYVDLPVTLSAPGTSPVSVAYATANGTASSGTVCNFNYVGVTGTLTFSPGVTTKVVRIDLLDCNLASPGSFTFNLSSPVHATITRTSTAVSIVQTPTVPGAPTHVTAVAGNQSAVVTFAAPASDGGDPVNSYTVTASPGGVKGSSATSPITVTGLTNGVSYTFTVTATNPEGKGPKSKASNAVVPSAPVSVTSIVPSSIAHGTSQGVTITGTGFVAGATVSVSGTGVTVSAVTLVSSTEITATITVSSTAATGTRTLTVTNPDQGTGTGTITIT
jgi:hypothetical protein